jgi:hypothetical protein
VDLRCKATLVPEQLYRLGGVQKAVERGCELAVPDILSRAGLPIIIEPAL